MANELRKPSAKERWGERVIITVLVLAGFVLIFASTLFKGLLQVALATIGLNFLSSAAVTFIILFLVGSDVGGLKSQVINLGQEVEKLHNILGAEIEAMYENIGRLSTLLNNAHSLGIIELGRSRRSPNFEGSKNFAERWKHLLEYAHEVDLICFADRLLFNSDVFNSFFEKNIRERMKQNSEKRLTLRIILTSLDNPHNKEINEWSGSPEYLENRILEARKYLIRLCGDTLNPDIIREHKSFVPFTLLRGDDYMYVMFFIPGHDGGPVLEIRPSESIAYPRIKTGEAEADQKLFRIYKSYFEEMWQNKSDPIIVSDSQLKT